MNNLSEKNKRFSKRKYICKECGNILPQELTDLIEKNVQVYCEKCGTPFIIEGVKFNQREFKQKEEEEVPKTQAQRPHHLYSLSKDQENAFNKLIQILNKISFIPLIIVSILILIGFTNLLDFNLWISTLLERTVLGVSGLLITLYDLKYISPEIKKNNFEKVVLDAFCWGILGSIIFGAGAIILIKGILVFLYALINPKEPQRKIFDFALYLKNSLNRFSATAGAVIILLGIHGIISGLISDLSLPVFIIFLAFSLVALIVDYFYFKNELKEKYKFEVIEPVGLLVLGILGVMFFASGIFILLKSILFIFLLFGKPSQSYINRLKQKKSKNMKQELEKKKENQRSLVFHKREDLNYKKQEKEDTYEGRKQKLQKAKIQRQVSKIKTEEKEEPKSTKEKEEELELQLNESLLPVRDKEDKKVVKKYFSKIFTILSKDIREQISELKISKKEKNELLKELAFLSKEEQAKYIKEIISLYKQEIPKKLMDKIRDLPNLKEEHYQKIVQKLKTMAPEEQIEYIQFLEKHAY